MVMKTRERSVGFYELRTSSAVRTENIHVMPITARDALRLARESMEGKPYLTMAGPVQIALEDWQVNDSRDEQYLLFNRADPKQSDVPFKNLRTGTARMAGKTPDEGIDLSVHVAIKFYRNTPHPLVLITGGAGLYADRIAAILSRLMRIGELRKGNEKFFRREHPSGASGKSLKISNTIELVGHQSQYLQQILKAGTLEGVELISDEVSKLDADFLITSKILKLSPTERAGQRTLSSLMRSFNRANTDKSISRARVLFKEHGETKVQSHTFPLNDLDSAFVRKEHIRFDTDISARYLTVSYTVIDKMRELM